MRLTTWRLPYPVGREAVVRRPDGRYVVAGGLVSGDRSTDRAFVLDPASGRSTLGPSLPVPVHDTAGVLLGGHSTVVGGGNSTEQDVVQTERAGRWVVTGHLPQPRSDLTAVLVGARVVVLGGYDAVTPAVPDVIVSSDGGTWKRTGTLPVPVRYAASAVLGRSVWLFGGERDGEMQDAVQRVDSSGRATVVARLPRPLGHAVALRVGRRMLVIGGRVTSDRLTSQMWWFDPRTAAFSPAGHLPVAVADSAVAADGSGHPDGAGTVGYLVGGESPRVSDRVWRVTVR